MRLACQDLDLPIALNVGHALLGLEELRRLLLGALEVRLLSLQP
jgi:hypothetical protein